MPFATLLPAKRTFVFAVLDVALTLIFVAQMSLSLQAEPPQELQKNVEAIAQKAIDSGRVVGLSIAIAKGDEILLAEGYGFADLESKTPATADTVYRIGSITKQFTAATILQLAELEKLDLDDPITKHLPDYPTLEPPVTIRHLLQHTSGIQSLTSLPSYRRLMRNDVSHTEMVARFKDLPQHFEAGERFQYCNSGYYLLGMITESVSQISYQDYLREHVFQPLKMKQSYYDSARALIRNRARGYRRRASGGFENARYLSMTQPFAAGALASSVRDLIRWQRGLVGAKVVTAQSFAQMSTPGKLRDGRPIPYGLGLFTRASLGLPTIGHGGGINGFRSDLTYYPQSQHTIVVLANCESAQPGQISKQIAKLLLPSRESKDTSKGKQ